MTNQSPSSDHYIAAIMRKIDQMLGEPLTPQQRQEVMEAIAVFKARKHPIDIRGVLPLHFDQFYFVLLMGKDRRVGEAAKDHELRQRPHFIGRVIAVLVMFWPLYLIVGFGYYVVTALPH